MTKKKMLVDLSQPFDDLLEAGNTVHHISGRMRYFPLCCSTGVLEDVQSRPIKKSGELRLLNPPHPGSILDNLQLTIKKLNSIHEIIRKLNSSGVSGMVYPIEFTRYYAMSLIAAKAVTGFDDSPDDGYSGFKASQITFFDRIHEDKDPAKGFKFTYNMTYSCDHLMEWLSDPAQSYLGETILSTPAVGAHGARVRGCIFTPDKDAVQKYHDDRLEMVRSHVLAVLEYQFADKETTEAKPAPSEAFVSY